MSSLENFSNNQAIEKIYVQTDKPYYFLGDTLWFKAYLFDEDYFNAKSQLMYVEISDDSNRLIKRIMLPVYDGLSFSYIPLNEPTMREGSYILRAYTSWTRNFGDDYVFSSRIYIGNTSDKTWLLKYSTQTISDSGRNEIQLSLKLSHFDSFPVILKEIRMLISDGRSSNFKNEYKNRS